MNIFYQTQQSISLDMTPILEKEGIVYTDITEALFIVKNKASDLDSDALAQLTLGDGLEWNDTNTKLLATFRDADWSNMEIGGKYLWGFGFKTADYSRFVEVKLTDTSLNITQDFIRA